MSLGIAFKGPEGIVLAADSRVTLMAELLQPNQPPMLLPSTYDNATKLLSVKGQDHVGAVTYGIGAIGQTEPRTAHSYIPELEQELKNVGRLSVQDFAIRLSQFFLGKWNMQKMPTIQGQDMVFLVGGYDEGAPYGKVFDIMIPSRPTPLEYHAGAGQFGLIWGGQREYADRLIHGFDGNLPELTKNFLNLDDNKRDELHKHLQERLQTPVPFAFLPLQDCVDLAIFLIRTTIAMQHWLLGLRGVGGAIDVAIITQINGFTEIPEEKGKRRRAMVIIQQMASSQTNSASTNDWIGQVKGGVIYAYDLSTLVSQNAGGIGFIKRDLEQKTEHVSRKSNLPVGEHIREAIQIIKGYAD